ncbi:response regulator [Crocosphaera sp. XPORK-15E]|uniref:response regulator n=1 Tax=Crocosphaera sp. XPORK-15E TaxID=3110247 RepID=UPI002B1FB8A9|nr:response regulator [Crocosphaera sp. XPORK-15E]MEA5536383.1 response regulator [Crocosphaera sp. XPORK-15E]
MSNLFTKPFLLLVEDSDEDFTAFMRFSSEFILEHPVTRCRNGEEALEFLKDVSDKLGCNIYQTTQLPALIILDLNLPGTDGREVLTCIIENPQWQQIPTIIFSSSADPRDIQFCYEHGAKSYILKPIDLNQLKKNIQVFWEYWFNVVILPNYQNL